MHTNRKSNLTKPSISNTQSSRYIAEGREGKSYSIRSPWDVHDDAMENFDKALAAMDVRVENPWDQSAAELRMFDEMQKTESV